LVAGINESILAAILSVIGSCLSISLVPLPLNLLVKGVLYCTKLYLIFTGLFSPNFKRYKMGLYSPPPSPVQRLSHS